MMEKLQFYYYQSEIENKNDQTVKAPAETFGLLVAYVALFHKCFSVT